MFEFFDQILGFFGAIWDILRNALSSVSLAFELLVVSTSLPSMFVGFVPTVIGSAIILFMAIYTVKFVVSLVTSIIG